MNDPEPYRTPSGRVDHYCEFCGGLLRSHERAQHETVSDCVALLRMRVEQLEDKASR